MQTTFILTGELIRKAVFRVWARRMRVPGIVFVAICCAYSIPALMAQETSMLGFGLFLWIFAAGALVAVYWRWLSLSMSRFRRMNDPTVEVTISADEFRWKSCLADSRVSWRAFEAIWQLPDMCLLFLAGSSYFAIPTDAIDKEQREFMSLKVRENGGRIR